jgi:hypothetical protein
MSPRIGAGDSIDELREARPRSPTLPNAPVDSPVTFHLRAFPDKRMVRARSVS